jgi:hypothetical protein
MNGMSKEMRLLLENEALKAELHEIKNPSYTYWSRMAVEHDKINARNVELQREVSKLRTALNQIAAWDEGPTVCGKFDEPASAKIAREALGGAPF